MNQAVASPEEKDREAALAAIAVWTMKYRYATGQRDDAMKCRPEDVARLARDLGVKPGELASLASNNPRSAALLEKMLRALGVEPGRLAKANPVIARDLERLCISCVSKERCMIELAAGSAAENFRDFCPNAFTLQALLGGEEA